MITIVDYGMGNLGSISNMLKKIGANCEVTSEINKIKNSKKIILPGVGSFDTAINKIDELGLRDIIIELVKIKKVPILGICLGMQLLLERSEEGNSKGLGLISGEVLNFKNRIDNDYKIPHMGWNKIENKSSTLIRSNFSKEVRFYFVHSYFVKVSNNQDSSMKCNFGLNFDAAIENDNIFGVQFHPEKSHKFGMEILKNFNAI
tara:strand:- start:161 stop:772 length:612 start_codon:yes stop_codon:yes gene_type:complete